MNSTGRAGGGVLTAVVVDDELSAREVLRGFIEAEPRMELIGEAGNGVEAVERVRELEPDLLFLDVQMPDRDGFGVLEDLGDAVPPGVVFVTAHDQYALRAFDVHAIDYLLKPFGRPRFRRAADRVLRSLQGERAVAALEWRRTYASLLESHRDRNSAAATLVDGAGIERIGVRKGTRTIVVDVPDIDWIEAADDHCRIHVADASHLVALRMRELEARLAEREFLRIHRSSIVNLGRVAELRRDPDGGGVVVLRDGVRLRVARSRWADLESALGL